MYTYSFAHLFGQSAISQCMLKFTSNIRMGGEGCDLSDFDWSRRAVQKLLIFTQITVSIHRAAVVLAEMPH